MTNLPEGKFSTGSNKNLISFFEIMQLRYTTSMYEVGLYTVCKFLTWLTIDYNMYIINYKMYMIEIYDGRSFFTKDSNKSPRAKQMG